MSESNINKRIEGRAKTIRELLDSAKYTIDFYQREYAWKERQIRELIDDLTGKFLDSFDPEHPRHQVEHYGHYFLGSIVISHKRNKRYIVDGQQRLTTLTLLLIYLNRLRDGRKDVKDVTNLIYSDKYGSNNFNLDVEDRNEVMQKLLDGVPIHENGETESIRNIAERYANISDHFPEEITGHALPYFVDWLLENVHIVEIEAFNDEDAYMIFETMNDRGLSLSLPEMLKGYILANITREADQKIVNTNWKAHMQAFKTLGDDEDADFFKNWLRARYAESIRPGQKGAENKDYEKIGSEFHRWVRDQKERVGLGNSDTFVTFVKRDLDFYARQALAIRQAAMTLTPGWESIFYNDNRGFTLQTQALLAALDPSDDQEVVKKKVALVADFLDIWIARRVWNFRTIAYSSVKYTLFTLTKDVRDQDVESLAAYLRAQLDEQAESFGGQPRLRLHQQNYRQIRHILARVTHWLDTQCGLASHFEDLVSQGRARPFEIEHIWADHFDRFSEVFAHPSDFDTARNQIGGLLLLQRGLNQSLGDDPYQTKKEAYATKGENLLARSLHPSAYQNNPAFRELIDLTGLAFRHYDEFGLEEQAERQELYIRLAEWVWNPSRIDLDGEKPPIHEPILDPEEVREEVADRPDRHEARLAYWERLLPVAKERSDLHRNISSSRYNWIGARKHGQWWDYVVLIEETRVELYIDSPEVADNKFLFDQLQEDKSAVEADFGGKLHWQRLDDKRASRISYTVPGGWAEDSSWDKTIDAAVDAMTRLYNALWQRVEKMRK